MFYHATSFNQNLIRWLQWVNSPDSSSKDWCLGAICFASTPTASPTGQSTDEPTTSPTATPTLTTCKYSKKRKCVVGGCVWKRAKWRKPAKCETCSTQTNSEICVKSGCLWTKAKRKKPGACESCADQKVKNCLKKECILVKKSDSPDKACVSCASMSSKAVRCLASKCAYDKNSKLCAPCSIITKEKVCDRMKSCEWKAEKGKCEKIKGKLTLTCCDLYQQDSTDYENCCNLGLYGACPSECPFHPGFKDETVA